MVLTTWLRIATLFGAFAIRMPASGFPASRPDRTQARDTTQPTATATPPRHQETVSIRTSVRVFNLFWVVPPGGLEPPTVGLKVRCSAIELEGLAIPLLLWNSPPQHSAASQQNHRNLLKHRSFSDRSSGFQEASESPPR